MLLLSLNQHFVQPSSGALRVSIRPRLLMPFYRTRPDVALPVGLSADERAAFAASGDPHGRSAIQRITTLPYLDVICHHPREPKASFGLRWTARKPSSMPGHGYGRIRLPSGGDFGCGAAQKSAIIGQPKREIGIAAWSRFMHLRPVQVTRYRNAPTASCTSLAPSAETV